MEDLKGLALAVFGSVMKDFSAFVGTCYDNLCVIASVCLLSLRNGHKQASLSNGDFHRVVVVN